MNETGPYIYQDITYDGLGNPTFYKGNTLTWTNVRQLSSYGDTTFAYGADGIRCRKNHIYYTLDGNRILKEYNQDTGKTITYLYGATGVVGFRYNGADYYYRKNLFGDVLAIYNANGTVVAEYLYDAWGRVLAAIDKTDLVIANINPIRYRSYYYDTETSLYYLESRYYDPHTGRFINADSLDYLGEGAELCNYNLFAYCSNNPIMRKDPTGSAWHILAGALLGGTISVFAGVIMSNIAGEKYTFSDGLLDFIGGGIAGALAVSSAGLAGQVAGNMAAGMAINALGQIIENRGIDNFDVGSMMIDGAISGISTAITGTAGKGSIPLNDASKLMTKNIRLALSNHTKNGVKGAIKRYINSRPVKKFYTQLYFGTWESLESELNLRIISEIIYRTYDRIVT